MDIATGNIMFKCRKTNQSINIARSNLSYIQKYNSCMPKENETVFIPLHIDIEIFTVIIEFIHHFSNDSTEHQTQIHNLTNIMPLDTDNIADRVPLWYVAFVERFPLHQDQLLQLLAAADDLGVDSLRTLLAAYIASRLKKKSPREIIEAFGLKEEMITHEFMEHVANETKNFKTMMQNDQHLF